jgi:protein TonB
MKVRKGSNRLFQVLFVISVGIHSLVFLHIAGIYRSRALSFIELTLQDMSKPVERNIPRPRPRPKDQPELVDPSRPRVEAHLPPLKPIKMEPMESALSDRLMERIDVASVPQVPGAAIFWDGLGKAGFSSIGDYNTTDAYLEMVRLRIEKHKQYPSQARAAHMEGRVTVRFTIIADGGVRSVEVWKSSGKKALDDAALQAVQRAGPFPAPPKHLFKGDIPLELTIAFELT